MVISITSSIIYPVVSAAFSPQKEDSLTIQTDQINIWYSVGEILHREWDLNLWDRDKGSFKRAFSTFYELNASTFFSIH
jgi:hypothetical protein